MSDRLDAALSVLASEPVDVAWADVESRLTVGASGPEGDEEFELAPAQTDPGRRPLLAVAAALVVVALVAVVLGTRGDQDLSPAEIGPSPEPSVAPTTGDPATRSSRWSAVTAWTGTHYLVWGGETGTTKGNTRADGWMFEPRTGEVTDIPTAPIAPRSGAAGVWTGTELVVCCGHAAANTEVGYTDTAAAFNASTGTWRRLPDPPLGTPGPSWFRGAAVWTGEEVLVVLSDDSGPSTVVAYDPEADSWRAIDGAPARLGNRTAAAWTGEELIVWPTIYPSLAYDSDGRIPGPAVVGHRYDPAADRWEPLPPMPETSAVDMPSIAWTGDELVVVGVSSVTEDRMTGARWNPDTGAWQPLPDAGLPPIDWYNGTPGSQGVAWDSEAGLLLVLPPHGSEWSRESDDGRPSAIPILAYDPSTDRWQHLDPARLEYAPDLVAAAGVLFQPDPDHAIVLRYGSRPPGDDPEEHDATTTSTRDEISEPTTPPSELAAYRLGFNQLGPITVGMRLQEVEAAGGVALHEDRLYEDFDCATWWPSGGGGVSFLALDGLLAAIDAHEPIMTIEGVGPGDTLEDILAAYGADHAVERTNRLAIREVKVTSPDPELADFAIVFVFHTSGDSIAYMRAGLADVVDWDEGCA